jgi:hypothetical protein
MRLLDEPNSDYILKASKWCIFASFLFMPLTSGLCYLAYSDDLAVSVWPYRISIAVMFLCCIVPILLFVLYRGTNSLTGYGMIGLFSIFPVYYFFGVFGYFYFFMFAPMLPINRWLGVLGGAALTVYWMCRVTRNVRYTIDHTRFVSAAFRDRGDGVIRYEVQRGMRIFEKHFVEPSPFPKPLAYVVLPIAPLCLVLPRILTSSFGTNGVLFVIAALSLPLSLWLIGVLVRLFLVTVALPLRIERERHKRVVVDA